MTHDKKHETKSRTLMLVVRVDEDQKGLVEDAAEREGLEISSFIIMLLVRAHILPDNYLKKIRRRPIPFYNDLHKLLGTINKIGGNCKQMADALPHTAGLRSTHAAINRAAEAVTDTLQGRPISATVNLLKFETELTDQGYDFNAIVRSVNMGKPQLSGLRAILGTISQISDAITTALTSKPITETAPNSAGSIRTKPTTDNIRTNMKKSAKASTKRQKDNA